MGFFTSKTTEHHADGGKTNRYDDGQSVTYDRQGNVTEHSRPESSIPVVGRYDTQVTYDGQGNVINVQDRK